MPRSSLQHLSLCDREGKSLVQIIGPDNLANELMASWLKSGLNFQDQQTIRPIVNNTIPSPQCCLDIIDCNRIDLEQQWDEIKVIIQCAAQKCYPVLYNVAHGKHIEQKAFKLGIRGIFYTTDTLEVVTKGIAKLLAGELWFSRDCLLNIILEEQSRKDSSQVAIEGEADNDQCHPALLTDREKEIIGFIAVGATNQEIADKLCISLHTVKSHLYKLFKKIDVPNRLQASLWAIKHLSSN